MKNKLILMGLLFIAIFGKTLCSDPRSDILIEHSGSSDLRSDILTERSDPRSRILTEFADYLLFKKRGKFKGGVVLPVIVREGSTYPDGKKLGVPKEFICHVGRAFYNRRHKFWMHDSSCEGVKLYISPHHSSPDDILKALTAALCLSKEGYYLQSEFKDGKWSLSNVLECKVGQDEARRRDFEEYVKYYESSGFFN